MGALTMYKKWFLRMTGMLKLGGRWETQYAAYERTGPTELTLKYFKGTMSEYQTHRYLKDVASECGWMILDKDIADYVIIYPDSNPGSPEDRQDSDVFNRMAGEEEEVDDEPQSPNSGCAWDNS
jgi:hypothetical protein